MNITFKNKPTIPYKDLSIGDVFRFQDHVYMMTDIGQGKSMVSVNLKDGVSETFELNVPVERYDNAELILDKDI